MTSAPYSHKAMRCVHKGITFRHIRLAGVVQVKAQDKVLQKKLCKSRQAKVKKAEADQGFAWTGHSPA